MPRAPVPALSAREQDVLAGIRDDQTYPQIARRLSVKSETVKTYAKRLRAKLRVHTKVGLALWAARHLPRDKE
jgi:DNA-binding CsgD family transcriptional regulator